MKQISDRERIPVSKKEKVVEGKFRITKFADANKRIDGNARMGDVVLYNERLLLVIERFGISLGFGDKTIEEICSLNGLDSSLVLMVMNMFINQFISPEDKLTEDMLLSLIDYLKQGHRYYLSEKLPYISGLIDRFIECTDNPDTKLLRTFFKEYSREVNEHIQMEDATVYPYIQALYNFSNGKPYNEKLLDYSINEFVEHHSDIEEKLEDLTHLLIRHFPPTNDRFYRNTILFELFALQYDLNDHGRIEENILVPLVRHLEIKKTGNVK